MKKHYIHIGSGSRKLPGFINMDLERAADAQVDMARLPFKLNEVAGIFSEYAIEDLTQPQAMGFLRECRRVLEPGGKLRVVIHDLESVITDNLRESTATGKVQSKQSRMDNRNELLSNLSPGERWLIYPDDLKRLAQQAGLTAPVRCAWNESGDKYFQEIEPQDGSCLILEFTKAGEGQSTEDPLVSILMPVYKPQFFGSALDSARQQTYANIEIVICDDSPTDEIRAIVQERIKQDPRIRYQRNVKPLGPRGNYIQCLDLAKGEYIKYLNDDDLLHPQCVERELRVLQRYPDVTLVTAHRQRIDQNDKPLPDVAYTHRPVMENSRIDGVSAINAMLLTGMNFIGEPTAVMFRKRSVAHIHPNLFSLAGRTCLAVGDQTIWANLLSQGDLVYLWETLSYFRIHSNQQQNQADYLALADGALRQLNMDARRMGFLLPGDPTYIHSRPLVDRPWQADELLELERESEKFIVRGDFQAASQVIATIVAVDADNPEWLIKQAEVQQMMGDLDAALREMSKATALHPTHSPTLALSAALLMQRGEIERAQELLDRLAATIADSGTGNGFYAREEDYCWMGPSAQIKLPTAVFQQPLEVSFELACSEADHYQIFPFDVNIFLNERLLTKVPFRKRMQVIPLRMTIPPTDMDSTIKLVSRASFQPASVGEGSDSRVLSVYLSQFVIRPLMGRMETKLTSIQNDKGVVTVQALQKGGDGENAIDDLAQSRNDANYDVGHGELKRNRYKEVIHSSFLPIDSSEDSLSEYSGARAIFTIVSKNYLGFARVFARTVLAQNPDEQIFVLLVDRVDGEFNPTREPFTLVTVEDLDNIPNREHLFFKYDVMELNTAVKPYFMEYLFEHYGFTQVLYFDPDILVLQQLDELWRLLEEHSIILTPHILEPYQDDRHPNEIDINQSGIFNLGFIGVSDTPSTHSFISWWQKRLYDFCASEVQRGLFTDQRWVNFAPAMFDGVFILRDPAYNIAYWNLHSRGPKLHFVENELYLGDRPVVFFHFSGFDLKNIEMVSKHQNRFTLSDLPHLRSLFELYRDLLIANGQHVASQWTYAYDFFDNGVRIPKAARKIYRDMGTQSLYFGDPFETASFANFYEWLQRDMIVADESATYPLSNLMGRIYLLRADLQRSFPDPVGRDARRLKAWFWENGRQQFNLDPVFIEQPQKKNKTKQAAKKPRRTKKNGRRPTIKEMPFGVNISGFLTGEFGNGQTARANVRAIQTTDIPHVLNNIVFSAHRQQDRSFSEFSAKNPYKINWIHANADTTPVLRNILGQEYFDDHYNIGLWWWELEHFPEKWQGNFKFFQEIWTQSRFCQQSIAHVSPIPVWMVPHVVYLDESQVMPDPERFGISPDVFTFLFAFDFYSVFERKNPLGILEAYRKAFGGGQDTQLILKSINSHVAPQQMRRMQEAAEGLNVKIFDRHVSRSEMLSLLASAQCYVSLHRSEGFGQGMAEAMYLGVPVIATGYSGNMDFMTPENSFPVRFQLTQLEDDYGPYEKGNVWAEPDTDHAAEMMRLVFEERDLAREKALRGSEDIKCNHSYQAVGQIIAQRVRQIAGVTVSSGVDDRQLAISPSHAMRVKHQAIEVGVSLGESQVDIVVPVYGHADLLRRCVESVLRTTSQAHLILVDDHAPGDEIAALFSEWRNHPRITIAATPENQGFIGATSLGARLGERPFILFLNSDTEATEPGWLGKMLPSDDEIGIVGARLCYPPDLPGPLAGTIQHAGVACNQDGIPYHPFLGWPADAPEVTSRREINAVTGACLLVRRQVWDDLGGWDPQFGKGVYEDVDLCWRARAQGYRVLYQPDACLLHRESASSGADGQHTLNAHTQENRQRLIRKWSGRQSDEALFFGRETLQRWQRARKQLAQVQTYIDKGDLASAIKSARKAVKTAPDLADAQVAVSQLYVAQGDHESAVEHLSQAVKIAPANWDARLRLVAALYACGRSQDARKALAHVAAVFPQHPLVLEWQSKLAAEPSLRTEISGDSHLRAQETLAALMEADDLVAALDAYERDLDEDLLALVRLNRAAASQDGNDDLAEGLAALEEYIEEVIHAVHEANDDHSRIASSTLEAILNAEDLESALISLEPQFDATLLNLIRENMDSARADGDDDLAAGLEELAAYVDDVLQAKDLQRVY